MTKKYTYKNEHILTVESLRSRIAMLFSGIMLMYATTKLFIYLDGTPCGSGAVTCNSLENSGMVLLVVLEMFIMVFGLALICMALFDNDGKKIKFKKEVRK